MRKSLVFLIMVVLSPVACRDSSSANEPTLKYQEARGETMGTYYSIKYGSTEVQDLKPDFDSILVVLNDEVSTYIPSSTISLFNQQEGPLEIGFPMDAYLQSDEEKIPAANQHFAKNYLISRQIYERTEGYFEPTIMPLVNYWGFGYTEKKAVAAVDSSLVDSLLQLVGMDMVAYEETQLLKTKPGVQLDFSGVAKGYGVDLLGWYLESIGIQNYLVEIGGEVRARGLNSRGGAWTIGVNKPDPNAKVTDFQVAATLQDLAVATSGNYRNFYEVEGNKYAHIINPKTGYTQLSDLLSATVFAEDCATADGFATAMMIMGREKALALAEAEPELEVLLIYGTADGGTATEASSGLGSIIRE
ncbi:MAG: FAD:protein FMN transferase [Bacteroidota bacterium]